MTTAEFLEPRAPYAPGPVVREKRCPDCGADVMRERHVDTCPALAEVWRLALDPAGRRLEDLLAACTRRAAREWLRSGRRFGP